MPQALKTPCLIQFWASELMLGLSSVARTVFPYSKSSCRGFLQPKDSPLNSLIHSPKVHTHDSVRVSIRLAAPVQFNRIGVFFPPHRCSVFGAMACRESASPRSARCNHLMDAYRACQTAKGRVSPFSCQSRSMMLGRRDNFILHGYDAHTGGG